MTDIPEKPAEGTPSTTPETPPIPAAAQPAPPPQQPLPQTLQISVANTIITGDLDALVEIGAYPDQIMITLKANGGWIRVCCADVPKLIERIKTAWDAAALLQSSKV